MAALLIKERVKGSEAARQKALRALMHPLSGNKLVRDTKSTARVASTICSSI